LKTPYGKECKFFYGDYFRGRNFEECRLLNQPGQKRQWQRSLCKDCPVPDILRANACPHMVISGSINKRFLLLGTSVKVHAYCLKSKDIVKNPKTGCGQCHEELTEIFQVSEQDT